MITIRKPWIYRKISQLPSVNTIFSIKVSKNLNIQQVWKVYQDLENLKKYPEKKYSKLYLYSYIFVS